MSILYARGEVWIRRRQQAVFIAEPIARWLWITEVEVKATGDSSIGQISYVLCQNILSPI
jgi:hypothetical protein